jgi:D-alanyl-D-alanine carboxypeptidase
MTLPQRRFTLITPMLPSLPHPQEERAKRREIGERLVDVCPGAGVERGWPCEGVEGCRGEMSAQAYCLVDLTQGRVLFGKKLQEPMEMASLTKIMTCFTTLLLVEKHELSLQARVRVKDEAASIEGTVAGLRPSDCLTI